MNIDELNSSINRPVGLFVFYSSILKTSALKKEKKTFV